MTPTDFTLEALSYLAPADGVVTIAGATAAQLRRLAHDLTATLQEIAQTKPDFYKRRLAANLAAPDTISLSVTLNSLAVSGVTLGGASLQNGATLLIDGDAKYNEIRLEGASYLLTLPYSGATGSHSATLYHDSIPLPAFCHEVSGPVSIPDNQILVKRQNRDDAMRSPLPCNDYGRASRVTTATAHFTGVPGYYWIEPFYGTDNTINHRLRVIPMPLTACTVDYVAKTTVPTYTVALLGTDGSPSLSDVPIPSNYAEAIALPLFLERWLASPWMRDASAAKEIKAQAKTARVLLNAIQVQRRVNRRITALF